MLGALQEQRGHLGEVARMLTQRDELGEGPVVGVVLGELLTKSRFGEGHVPEGVLRHFLRFPKKGALVGRIGLELGAVTEHLDQVSFAAAHAEERFEVAEGFEAFLVERDGLAERDLRTGRVVRTVSAPTGEADPELHGFTEGVEGEHALRAALGSSIEGGRQGIGRARPLPGDSREALELGLCVGVLRIVTDGGLDRTLRSRNVLDLVLEHTCVLEAGHDTSLTAIGTVHALGVESTELGCETERAKAAPK